MGNAPVCRRTVTTQYYRCSHASMALVAAALERDLYESLEHHEGLVSLQTVFDKPIEYALAPELFCLDFFRDFDIPQLTKLTRH